MENNILHADVVVIGFGKGGKAVAATLGRLGKRVVLIEKSDQMYGGTCPNVGCVPTKALVHHSSQSRADDSPQEWFEHTVEQVQALTSLFRAGNYDALNGADTITLITGAASFVDPYTVAVGEGSDRITVVAETILINAGSAPVIADIPGLRDSSRLVTNVDLIKEHETSRPAGRHRRRLPGHRVRLDLPPFRVPGHRPRVFGPDPRVERTMTSRLPPSRSSPTRV